MGRRIAQLLRTLSARLTLRIFLTVAILVGVYSFVSAQATQALVRELMTSCAAGTGELVASATHYAMLLNRKDEVHYTMREIAAKPSVHNIRVYDKDGRIIFSAVQEEISRQVDLQAEACVICHQQTSPLRSVPISGRSRYYVAPGGEELVGVIRPIRNEARCAQGACHAHPDEQSILGILDVQMSVTSMNSTFRAQQRWLLLALAVLLLGAGAGCSFFVYRMLWRPVRYLASATARVANGDLNSRVEIMRHDELGELGDAFNRMSRDLDNARCELTGWSSRLEARVVETTEELGRIQRSAMHMEKMASLGRLAATVAHEINNPLAGILTYAKLVQRRLTEAAGEADSERQEIEYLRLIQQESTRCGAIVRNLLTFARQGESAMKPAHLVPILEKALQLTQHQLEMIGAQREVQLNLDDDRLVCDVSQIEQVLVGLLVNAAEAMAVSPGGTLCVCVRETGELLQIEITDTGVGISAEALPHVFEPFFTTKEAANGVGLGLAIAYGIVKRHGGEIDIGSRDGGGTRALVTLPRSPPTGQQTHSVPSLDAPVQGGGTS